MNTIVNKLQQNKYKYIVVTICTFNLTAHLGMLLLHFATGNLNCLFKCFPKKEKL